MRREKLSEEEEEEENEQKDDGKDEDDHFIDFRYEISHHQIGSGKFVLFKLTLNHLKKSNFLVVRLTLVSWKSLTSGIKNNPAK